jgi:hypothetical protein
MASKVDICNMALSRLSCKPIISLSDNTTEAKTLNIIYDMVAENVMALGPWTSCTKRATLAQLTDTPDWGYTYQYQLPTDPKFIKCLLLNECKKGDIDFAIEGDKLLCNETTAQIKYIALITDTESYDAYLRQAITERLICEMAYQKTGSEGNLDRMEKVFAAKVDALLNMNNTQGNNNEDRDLPSDTFTDIRNEN